MLDHISIDHLIDEGVEIEPWQGARDNFRDMYNISTVIDVDQLHDYKLKLYSVGHYPNTAFFILNPPPQKNSWSRGVA